MWRGWGRASVEGMEEEGYGNSSDVQNGCEGGKARGVKESMNQ